MMVKIGDATLYLGDCLDILPKLGKVDAVVTDPPYGIGFKFKAHNDSPKLYPDFLKPRLDALEACCRPGSPVFVWQAMRWMPRFHELFAGRKWRIFAAIRDYGQCLPITMQYRVDPIVCWWTAGPNHNPKNGFRDWCAASTADTSINANTFSNLGHPTARPLRHVEYIIENVTEPGDTILDAFMGSGTMGVACAKLGRKFIGIEIEPEYFAIAEDRIGKAYARPALFPVRHKTRARTLFS